MEITIKGSEKEIAALAVELQKQQIENLPMDKQTIADSVIKNGVLLIDGRRREG
jgi:hypothetical protein